MKRFFTRNNLGMLAGIAGIAILAIALFYPELVSAL
jgi:hypothetical protein